MATLESINARIAKLKAQAETLVSKKSTAVLDKIRGLMEKHGIVVSDIEAHAGKRRGRKPGTAAAKQSASVAKYRDPKTGATWTGHGRAPAWIANAKDRTKYLVDGATASAAAPSKAVKVPKAGNYARGPQPALYADPKTGATWSGRGRAPAWIAAVKDRSKFLIAGAQETAAKSQPAKKANGGKKAVTAKKAGPVSAKKATAAKKASPAKKATAVTKTAAANKAGAPKKATTKKAVSAKRATAKKATQGVEASSIVTDTPAQITELSRETPTE